jgi:hypothetical protein
MGDHLSVEKPGDNGDERALYGSFCLMQAYVKERKAAITGERFPEFPGLAG